MIIYIDKVGENWKVYKYDNDINRPVVNTYGWLADALTSLTQYLEADHIGITVEFMKQEDYQCKS